MKILIIDNNIDQPWKLCEDFRRYIGAETVVRRAPQEDLPPSFEAFSHIILSGSKTSIHDSSPWVLKLIDFVRQAADAKRSLLGVCYGHQIIARAFGGETAVRTSPTPEFGWVEMEQKNRNPILEGLSDKFYSFQAHFEEVVNLPKNFIGTASSARCPVQAYFVEGKPIFGVQFHPERNVEEGQKSIESQKKTVSGDCIFNAGKAKSLYSENVARIIFRNFLAQNARVR